MRICFTELLLELSYALDCVEHDLLGVATNHSKRVAYLCICMGKALQMDDRRLCDLAACAVLHDNALTEYIQAEYLNTGALRPEVKGKQIGIHCSLGERNVKEFPFFSDTEKAILYHHENADGSGPFGKSGAQIPRYAALIHLADQVDAAFRLGQMTTEKYQEIIQYLKKNQGSLFGQWETALFIATCSEQNLGQLGNDSIDALLRANLPYINMEYEPEKLIHMAGIIARIIDYKSTFTSLHSVGIANKAYKMGGYYHEDEETRAKLFLAGAFHDIGKLAVDVAILEKPGKLTEEEFVHMKNHAALSYEILGKVGGFEEIKCWAALHHEKLDGSGYPFGYKAEQLGFYERLLACLDIYQALCEERPYKSGKSHQQSMAILQKMADRGLIDGKILPDIDAVFGEAAALS